MRFHLFYSYMQIFCWCSKIFNAENKICDSWIVQKLIRTLSWLLWSTPNDNNQHNTKKNYIYVVFCKVFQQIFIFTRQTQHSPRQSILLTMQKLHSYSYLDFNPYTCPGYCPAAVVWFKYLFIVYLYTHDSANIYSVYIYWRQ